MLTDTSTQRILLPVWILCASLLLHCSNESPDSFLSEDSVINLQEKNNPVNSIELTWEMVFSDSLLLEEINDVVSDENGRVFFAGQSWNRREVYIFNENGTFNTIMGSYGERDGQFLEISRLQLHDRTLFVFDDRLNRVTTFDAESGAFIDTIAIDSRTDKLPHTENGYNNTPVAFLNDGNFLMRFNRQRDPAYEPHGTVYYSVVDREGNVVKGNILQQEGMRYLVGDYAGRPAPFTIPIPEKPLLDKSRDGTLYSAFSDQFMIHVHNLKGDHLRSYFYLFERHDLNPDELIHPRFTHIDQLLRIRESADYPEKWPALYSLLIDDENRIWVSTITDDRDVLEWWVIDDRLEQITARFHWPFDKPIYHIKNQSVYTVEENSSGFKEVVRYGLQIR